MASKLPVVTAADIPLLDPVRVWECPAGCGARDRTTEPGNIQPTHHCRLHNGLSIPMQAADRYGVKGKPHRIQVVDRGDYMGDAHWHRSDSGRTGAMAVHAYRPDGSHDTVVFAPAASVPIGANDL